MLRKFVCAGFVLAIAVGIAAADEFRAVITKVDGGKVTFKKMKGGGFQKGQKPEFSDPMTLPTAADVKVVSSKFNRETKKSEAGEPLTGGLSNEKLKNIGDKGVFGTIITDTSGQNITELRVSQFGGRGGFKNKKKKKDAE